MKVFNEKNTLQINKKILVPIKFRACKKNDFTVKNGLFKNLKINKDISWGKADIASKVYGL